MTKVEVKIKPLHPKMCTDIPLPRVMSSGAAGMDVAAAIDAPITLAAGERTLVACGFSLELPLGFEAQLRPRSGLAMRVAGNSGSGSVSVPLGRTLTSSTPCSSNCKRVDSDTVQNGASA